VAGRYLLTIEYDEPNPVFVAPEPDPYYGRDPRLPNERIEQINRRVLSCEITAEQWKAIQKSVLEVS